MPLYDFKCLHCDHTEERIVPYDERLRQVCECGSYMHITWQKGHVFVQFKPRVFNGFAGPDVLVESKKQLKALCKEHDCSSVHLMDS